MRSPKSLRANPNLKTFLKADVAGFALVAAAQYGLPERRAGGLPDIDKGPMPTSSRTRSSKTDSACEAALRFVVEDGIAAAIYLTIA